MTEVVDGGCDDGAGKKVLVSGDGGHEWCGWVVVVVVNGGAEWCY